MRVGGTIPFQDRYNYSRPRRPDNFSCRLRAIFNMAGAMLAVTTHEAKLNTTHTHARARGLESKRGTREMDPGPF